MNLVATKKANVASRLATETPVIRDLIAGVKKGEIKIPQFQRRFVWRDNQALNLLDSIGSNYPVGSLLLWRTGSKLATERDLGDFTLPATDDLTPTDYVLDGQQRLTVIYSCLGALESDPGFQAAYDLVGETFIRRPDSHSPHIFPLRILYDTTRLLNFRAGLVSHAQSETLQLRLDQLIEVVTNYRIPVVILKDLSLEEVCPIFERINSSGTPLSTYDLMVAATWSEQFDLNDEAQRISAALEPKGFGDIEGNTVLKCLSAVHSRSIKRDDVLSLRKLTKAQMDNLVERTRAALLKTVDLLTTEFRVYSWDFLPYEAYAVILAYTFAKRGSLSAADLNRVRVWFWSSAFAERYRGASEHFVSRDLEIIDGFLADGKTPDPPFGSAPSLAAIPKLKFRSDNSRSRAFILLLARRNPRNITNGAAIDTAEALSTFNKKQFHHLYPKAFLKKIGETAEQNTPANICMLAASENNSISDEDPSAYFPKVISMLGSEAALVFSSNFLPDPLKTDYSTLDYPAFIELRSKLLHEEMSRLCAGPS